MRPRRRGHHRYSPRSAGQEAALRHIEEARDFSREIGGTDDDVKRYFFSLSGSALDEIFSAYGKVNGKVAEQYARETFQKWKTGSTHISGLVARRLFDLLPPKMPAATKLELAGNIWRHFGPRSAHSYTVGPAADVESVIEAISDTLNEAIQNYQIPDQVRACMYLTYQKTGCKDATVVYLPGGGPSTCGRDVERINSFAFYDLGKTLKQLESLSLSPQDLFWSILQTQAAANQLLEGKPIPLGISRGKCQALHTQIMEIWGTVFVAPDTEGKPTVQVPDTNSPPIEGWRLYGIKKALEEFETVFAEEMRENATYFVPRRGIFFTPALVDSADDTFPAGIVGHIPQKTREDWRAAGRCLAFNLLTASGFHVARAVEGILEAYYQRLTGKTGTLNGWQDYIDALEKVTKAGASPSPQAKTLAELEQMKKDYRNPLAHPRIVLDEADARMLFANGESLIIAMAQELATIAQAGVQPQLGLVVPHPAPA